MKKHWKYGILGLLVVGSTAAYLTIPRQPIGTLLPIPNGYEDLLKAAISAVPEGRALNQLDDDELRNLVNQNRSTLDLARLGLKRECRVPIQYQRGYLESNMQVLPLFKTVA